MSYVAAFTYSDLQSLVDNTAWCFKPRASAIVVMESPHAARVQTSLDSSRLSWSEHFQIEWERIKWMRAHETVDESTWEWTRMHESGWEGMRVCDQTIQWPSCRGFRCSGPVREDSWGFAMPSASKFFHFQYRLHAVPFFSLSNWETGASDMWNSARDWSERDVEQRARLEWSPRGCASRSPQSLNYYGREKKGPACSLLSMSSFQFQWCTRTDREPSGHLHCSWVSFIAEISSKFTKKYPLMSMYSDSVNLKIFVPLKRNEKSRCEGKGSKD